MKYDCELIRDIAPLYRDRALGEKSAAIVEEHLGECGACKSYYDGIMEEKTEVLPPGPETGDPDTAVAASFGKKIGTYRTWQLVAFGCAAAAMLTMLPPWFGYRGITEIPGTAALGNPLGLIGAALYILAVWYGFKSRRARAVCGFAGWGMWLFAELYAFITIPMGYVRGYDFGFFRVDVPAYVNFSLSSAFHNALPEFYVGVLTLLAAGAVFLLFLRKTAPDIK